MVKGIYMQEKNKAYFWLLMLKIKNLKLKK